MCKPCVFCNSIPEVWESATEISIFCQCEVKPLVTNQDLVCAPKKEVRIGWNYLQKRLRPYTHVITQLEGNYSSLPQGRKSKKKCPNCQDSGRNINLNYISSQGIYGCYFCNSLFVL